MALTERHYLEELQNVVSSYPLEPGDTLSSRTAAICCERRWIVRDAAGRWIPTALGVRSLAVARGEFLLYWSIK